MSTTKENAFNFQYEQSIGLGIRVHIGDGWMWFCGFKFGVPIVNEDVKKSVRVAPNHLNSLTQQLQDMGYSISIMMRKGADS